MQQTSQPEYQQQRIISDLERKLRRMTILVGIIGSDGIVLAADQRRIRLAANESEFDDPMGGLKITHLEGHKVVYAVAGDDLTDEVGYGVVGALDNDELKFASELELERSLQGFVERKFADVQKTDTRRWEWV